MEHIFMINNMMEHIFIYDYSVFLIFCVLLLR